MSAEIKIVQPNYEAIREMSKRIDSTVTEADFSTEYPNSNRIACVAEDINRYLKHKNGGKL